MDGGGGGSSGGGGQSSTNTSYNVSLQPELMPYATDIAQKAQTLSAANYTPFQGQRIAGFSPLQQQAQGNIANMQTAGQLNTGTDMATMGGIGSLNAGQQYNQMATNPGAVGQFMSPYMQNAVDWQKDQAIRDDQVAQTSRNAQATNAGAFGGSRHAIMDSEAQRALGNRLSGIQAQGTQSAFDNAMKSMQFGTQTGLQGYNQANQAAGTLGQIGQTEFGQNMGINQAQQQAGQQQQSLNQQGLTQNYQDFLKQQEYPYSQLSFYNSMIRGLSPVMPTTTQTYTAPPSGASQMASLGLGAYGLSGLFGGKAEGGAIKGFAEGGGIVGFNEGGSAGADTMNLSEQLERAKKTPPEQMGVFPPLIQALAMQYRQQMQTALQGEQAQSNPNPPSVITKMIEGQPSGLEQRAPESVMTAAEGGIVPMAEGGGVQHFYEGGAPRNQRELAELMAAKRTGGVGEFLDFGVEEQPTTGSAFAGPSIFERLKNFANRPPAASRNPADAALSSIGGSMDDGKGMPTSPKATPKTTPKPTGTKAASAAAAKEAAAVSGYTSDSEAIARARGIAPGNAPVSGMEDDLAGIKSRADGIAGLLKPERDTLTAAQKARLDAAEEKERRIKANTGYAKALEMAGMLAQPGQAKGVLGFTGLDKALGIAGKGAAEYEQGRISREEKMADLKATMDEGAYNRRAQDVSAGASLYGSGADRALKAAEAQANREYQQGMLAFHNRETRIKELMMASEQAKNMGIANHYNNAAGAGARGAITPAVLANLKKSAIAAADKAIKDGGPEMAQRLKKNPQLRDEMIQHNMSLMLPPEMYASAAPTNPNWAAAPPAGEKTISLFGRS